MTYTIFCRFNAYRWVATCPEAGKEFVMTYPHGSPRQAADDVARQIMGEAFDRNLVKRKHPKIYELSVPALGQLLDQLKKEANSEAKEAA